MKRKTAVIILTIATLSFLVYYFVFSQWLSKRSQTVNTEKTYEITGILREMFIETETKQEIQLQNGRFQLALINAKDLKNFPPNTKSLYIELYEGNLNGLVGKCVQVKGKIDADWLNRVQNLRNKNNPLVSSGVSFIAESVNKQDYSKCDGYKDSNNKFDTNQTKRIITGEIERTERTEPDLDKYDYVIVEGTESDFVMETTTTKTITETPVVPTNNEIWQLLEKNINRRVAIEGYEIEDKQKIRAVYITRIME